MTASGSAAGSPHSLIFEDKFETLDPSWGKSSDRPSADKGALVIKAEPGQGRWAISQSDYYTDAAICVDATVMNVPDPNSGFIAIVFWYKETATTTSSVTGQLATSGSIA